MKYWILVCLLLLLLPIVSAAPSRVIINSADWHDVYSGMLYASLQGIESNFLVSQKHGAILLYSISTDEPEIQVISSRSQPYVFGYEAFMESRGYSNVNELVTRDANIELAQELENITDFIVIDPAYGYNAISAAPYSVVSNSYVLFADDRNIDDIADFLQERNPTSVILFGQLDRDVKEQLAQFDPETINEGDRFSNNMVMVDRYREYADTRQVILTNGEFIESGVMSGTDPVVYIGKSNVPQRVQDYITSSDTEVGILIGNELIGTATTIRRQLGISVFVKFAQGARTPQGAIAQVEDLDRFAMPNYDLGLEITSIVYNTATRSLEVTYHNTRDIALYFRSTITIQSEDGTITVGDENAIFLDGNEYKTIVYSQDTEGEPILLQEGDLTANLLTIFGEGPRALELALQATLRIDFVDVNDETDIDIAGLYYDRGKQQFFVQIDNIGSVNAYVYTELLDLEVNGEEVTVGSDETPLIEQGKSAKIPVSIEMTEADFEDNPQITVRAYYGEREISLVKIKEKTFPLEFGGFAYTSYIIYGAIILLILLLIGWLGTKKKCKHCGHKNARGRKKCEKCHQQL